MATRSNQKAGRTKHTRTRARAKQTASMPATRSSPAARTRGPSKSTNKPRTGASAGSARMASSFDDMV
jgi:hypothetical protein